MAGTGISLSDIIAQVGKASTVLDTGTDKIEKLTTEGAAISMDSSSVLKTAAAAAANSKSAEVAAALATQQARQALGLDFGTDRDAQNEVYSGLAAVEKENWQKQVQLKDVIDKKSAVSFTDDPIAWLGAKLTINDDIAQHNAANQNRQAALQRINDLNAVTLSSASLQAQFANTLTATSAADAAALAAANWTKAANDSALQGITFNIEGVKAAMALPKEKLGFLFQTKQAQNADASLAVSQAHLKLSQDEFAWRKEEKDAATQSDSFVVDSVNKGRAIRGLPALDEARGKQVIAMIKGKLPLDPGMQADYYSGMQQDATGMKVLGITPADVIERFSKGQAINLGPLQDSVKSRLQDATQMVKIVDPKDVAGNTKQLNDAAIKLFSADAAEVRPGDTKNPFSIQPIAQIVKTNDAAAAEPVYQKVLKPMIDAGVDMNDPNKVMAATLQGLRNKTITYNEAIGLTTIYQSGSAVNLASRDFSKFGLGSLLSSGTAFKYNVRVEDYNWGGSVVVDLTKPDALGRYLNKSLQVTDPFLFNAKTSEILK